MGKKRLIFFFFFGGGRVVREFEVNKMGNKDWN